MGYSRGAWRDAPERDGLAALPITCRRAPAFRVVSIGPAGEIETGAWACATCGRGVLRRLSKRDGWVAELRPVLERSAPF